MRGRGVCSDKIEVSGNAEGGHISEHGSLLHFGNRFGLETIGLVDCQIGANCSFSIIHHLREKSRRFSWVKNEKKNVRDFFSTNFFI
jgi:hypothetical protein